MKKMVYPVILLKQLVCIYIHMIHCQMLSSRKVSVHQAKQQLNIKFPSPPHLGEPNYCFQANPDPSGSMCEDAIRSKEDEQNFRNSIKDVTDLYDKNEILIEDGNYSEK